MGVFLKRPSPLFDEASRPHARGGVSTPPAPPGRRAPSSPRPWGCFPQGQRARRQGCVVPTPVGVFPAVSRSPGGGNSRPHARGGVSLATLRYKPKQGSSPRPWGCFQLDHAAPPGGLVVPTPVGVFPNSAPGASSCSSRPHARGGVSIGSLTFKLEGPSSPRPWGCFRPGHHGWGVCAVVPTPVGVFPSLARMRDERARRPHARGGVSSKLSLYVAREGSSPRPWGCFQRHEQEQRRAYVVPTPVGVFPE